MPRGQPLLSRAANLLGDYVTTSSPPGLASYGAKRYANSSSISSTRLARWMSTTPAADLTGDSSKPLKLGFIGAGGINFGTPAGCWNHAAHLERFDNVSFSAVCDLKQSLAQQRIDDKKSSGGTFAHKWQGCKAFATHREMLEDPESRPDAVIVGTPPHTRGALHVPGGSVELDLAEAGIHMLLEKPVSVQPYEEVAEMSAMLDEYHRQSGVVVGVGYMLRYAAGVDMAKQLLARVGSQPISVLGRMSIGYSYLNTPFWWDSARSGGPIVEQATHFIDLMRYLCGEIVPESISSLAVGPNMFLSDMPQYPNGEHTIPMDRRVNRSTSAVFNFESGAVGNLFHSAVLEGAQFTAELDIFGDGIHIVIGNPYYKPFLKMRSSRSDDYEEVEIPKQGEAMYDATFAAFLQAVRTKNPSLLRSPFSDALKTYQTSRWIADASKQTPQSVWNASTPWITRTRPALINDAASVVQDAQEQPHLQVDIHPVAPAPELPQGAFIPPPLSFNPGQPTWPQGQNANLTQQRAASSAVPTDAHTGSG